MKIMHLSDLHFGTEIPMVVDAVITEVKKLQPDLIIISGDFTQRATRYQFEKSKQFIASLNRPVFCIIGNHDISLHNLFERLVYPFAKYKKYITTELNPTLLTENMAIFGLTSATPFKAQNGVASTRQIGMMQNFFNRHSSPIRIVVLHHNLIRSYHHRIISNAENLIQACIDSQVNLILSGHLHYPYIEKIKSIHPSHHLYSITAGTTTSHRLFGHANSFNVIEFIDNAFTLKIFEFHDNKFKAIEENTYSL